MPYVRPRIRFRENNRHIARGAYYDANIGRFIIQATEGETVKTVLDYTDLLDGATITIATAADGLTVSTPVVATGLVTFNASAIAGVANLDLTVTYSDGRIHKDYLRFSDPFCWSKDDYTPEAVN
jgi:hypothetical protein